MKLLQETLEQILPPDQTAMEAAAKHLDSLLKPLGSLGRLEEIAIKLAGITGCPTNTIGRKCCVVMAADNGVWEEKVSSCPQEVTRLMVENFMRGLAGINVLSRLAGADLRVVDVGIKGEVAAPGVVRKKIMPGTNNMAKGPAMSREQAVAAIEVGIETVNTLAQEGYGLIGVGEMGIGNTTTASAVLMALTRCSSDVAVGKGAGLTEEDLARKKRVVQTALMINQPDPSDPLDVLAKVGGLDIAAMAGCFLGAAARRIPVVADGFISAVAALAAQRLQPLVTGYLFPSHLSAEPGAKAVHDTLGLQPFLHLNMRLGEGTGAALAFHLIEGAARIGREMGTFDQGMIHNDFLVDVRG